jgi:hypothetical protein
MEGLRKDWVEVGGLARLAILGILLAFLVHIPE